MASFSFSSCRAFGFAPSYSPNCGVVFAGVVFVEFCRDLDLERACYSDLSATSSRMSSWSLCSSRCCKVSCRDPGDSLPEWYSESPDPRRLSLAAASSASPSSSSFSLIVLRLIIGFLALIHSSPGSSGACFPTSIKFLLFNPSTPLFCIKSLFL